MIIDDIDKEKEKCQKNYCKQYREEPSFNSHNYWFKNLQHISLSHFILDIEQLNLFCTSSFVYNKIRSVDLSFCKLNCRSCIHLSLLTRKAKVLHSLNLTGNFIGDKGVLEIAVSLTRDSLLKRLHLIHNNFSLITHYIFGKVLLSNSFLEVVDLGKVESQLDLRRREMSGFSRRLSGLYSFHPKQKLDMDPIEADNSNKFHDLMAVENRVHLMSLIQHNEKALLKGANLKKQILQQNQKMNRLNYDKQDLDDRAAAAIKSIKRKASLRGDKKLLHRLKSVNDVKSLMILNKKLQKKSNENEEEIRQKLEEIRGLEENLENTVTSMNELMKQHEKMKEEGKKIATLTECIRHTKETQAKFEETNKDIISKVRSSQTVKRAEGNEVSEAVQTRINELVDRNKIMEKEIVELRAKVKEKVCIKKVADQQDQNTDAKNERINSPKLPFIKPEHEPAFFKELLIKGECFAIREKFSMFWKSPQYLWISDDMLYLCMSKGSTKEGVLLVKKIKKCHVSLQPWSERRKSASSRRESDASSIGSMSLRSVASSVSVKVNPFGIKKSQRNRVIKLSLKESKDLIANDCEDSNLVVKQLQVKAASEDLCSSWERALKWWLRSDDRPRSSSGVKKSQSRFYQIGVTDDPLDCDEVYRLHLKNTVGDIVKEAYEASTLDESLASHERKTLSITYRNVRERVQEVMDANYDGPKWKGWFRREIDQFLEKYGETSEEDSQL